MNPAIATIIASLLNFAFEIWRTHSGKPAGWVPSQAEIDGLLAEVDTATPEAEKTAARKRIGQP
jgi:hypothetical protein